jgi:hypothetical protein
MRTLTVSITDKEFKKFGLKSEKMSFSEFVSMISRKLAIQSLEISNELAEKYGLSEMSMKEIDEEVNAARKK